MRPRSASSPARPLLRPVAALRRRPGTREPFSVEVPLDDLATSAAAVDPDDPVAADLLLESIADGVVVCGTVAFRWRGACRRCLEEVVAREEVEVREVFEPDPVEGETWPLGAEHLDLEPVVREAVLVNLPLAPLCSEGCRGPAPDAFPATVASGDEDVGSDTGEGRGRDPRWAALDELDFDA